LRKRENENKNDNLLTHLQNKTKTIPKSDVLLSLVRTKTVGHLRDVRRLIVAMSRARLGLYVFCRV